MPAFAVAVAHPPPHLRTAPRQSRGAGALRRPFQSVRQRTDAIGGAHHCRVVDSVRPGGCSARDKERRMTTPKEQETTLLMEKLDGRDNRGGGADSRDSGKPHL